jgi:hypothetical protein
VAEETSGSNCVWEKKKNVKRKKRKGFIVVEMMEENKK